MPQKGIPAITHLPKWKTFKGSEQILFLQIPSQSKSMQHEDFQGVVSGQCTSGHICVTFFLA
jgi:hypothetical protein